MNKACGMQRLPNLFGTCTITENVDGLVAAVDIRPKGRDWLDGVGPWFVTTTTNFATSTYGTSTPTQRAPVIFTLAARKGTVYEVRAAAGKRWATPDNDNHGFAAWVWENADELVKLGPGRHVGRWWGKKINRGYGLDERRFSLINYERWSGPDKPDCVHVLPMIYKGDFHTNNVVRAGWFLKQNGSYAAPGFDNPFGLIVYHHSLNNMFRVAL